MKSKLYPTKQDHVIELYKEDESQEVYRHVVGQVTPNALIDSEKKSSKTLQVDSENYVSVKFKMDPNVILYHLLAKKIEGYQSKKITEVPFDHKVFIGEYISNVEIANHEEIPEDIKRTEPNVVYISSEFDDDIYITAHVFRGPTDEEYFMKKSSQRGGKSDDGLISLKVDTDSEIHIELYDRMITGVYGYDVGIDEKNYKELIPAHHKTLAVSRFFETIKAPIKKKKKNSEDNSSS